MTKETIMKLTLIVAKRYLKAKTRKEKTKILDEYLLRLQQLGLHFK